MLLGRLWMPKIVSVRADIPDDDLFEVGVFLSKEDCKLLKAELASHGCFNVDRKQAFDGIMNLVWEMANEE